MHSRFLNKQAALSPEVAIRLDKAFGADVETLMRMQGSYDIAQARQRQGEISVRRYVAADYVSQTGSQRKEVLIVASVNCARYVGNVNRARYG